MIKLDLNNPKNNILLLKDLSTKYFPNNKILADLTVVQGILESNLTATPSKLASVYNNLFGIKYPTTSKNRQFLIKIGARAVGLNTTEYTHTKINAFFVWFNSLEDCMKYRQYMMTWSIYKDVGESKTFEEAAKRISKNYATDPKYQEKLVKIYNLYLRD